ncbi:MAG: exosortase [Erythrobacter sp.]
MTFERTARWRAFAARLSLAWATLFAITFREWSQMAFLWWHVDTYSFILLVPAIVVWLVWMRRGELALLEPGGWWPGLLIVALGLTVWLGGRAVDIRLFAQAGTVLAFQGAAVTFLGLRASLILAFPIAYSSFLVPFGDEIFPQLQAITAHIATALTNLSGVDTVSDGIYIDTPAGLFIVAEACAGVRFLIAMVALGVLVVFTCFESWSRRAWFMLACFVVPIVANGIRAWATIYVAQYVGAERAGSFDHIVYGWFFFGIVIALVLGIAWRFFERDPEDAGWTLEEVDALPHVAALEDKRIAPTLALGALLVIALLFAALVRLV